MEAIILASGSPRRSQILTQMGVAFEKHAAEVDEHCALGAREAVDAQNQLALLLLTYYRGIDTGRKMEQAKAEGSKRRKAAAIGRQAARTVEDAEGKDG